MWHSAVTALVLISQVTAGVISDAGIVARRGTVEDHMRRAVERVIEPIEKRQQTAMNVTQWDTQTQAACTTSLEALNGVASNPSGLAACYNLPMLDNTTGIFQADLRIFKISDPTGTFANIPSNNIQVGLSYIGATISKVNKTDLGRRDEPTSLISWPKRQVRAEPVLVQEYTFVGQINADLIRANMGTADLQDVLVPTVSLTGTDGAGNRVNTTLSSQEATFVSGVFAVQDIPTISQKDVPLQTLVVASDQPFVVPGLDIMIFPIGGIITGVWAVLFCATVAYGTFGRNQFREDFRRRAARAEKGNLQRI